MKYDIQGVEWRNETWLNESVTLTRGELKQTARVHADVVGFVTLFLFTYYMLGAHAGYCMFLLSGKSYKTI